MGLGNILQPPTGVGGKSKETSLERPMGSCLCIAASYKLIYPSQSLLYNAQCKYVCQASTHTIFVRFVFQSSLLVLMLGSFCCRSLLVAAAGEWKEEGKEDEA